MRKCEYYEPFLKVLDSIGIGGPEVDELVGVEGFKFMRAS
jgi:hypothetical protein